MRRPRACLSILLTATLLLTACAGVTDASDPSDPGSTGGSRAEVDVSAAGDHTVIVHRTASCSCCGEYEAYLEAVGFTVVPEIHDDLTEVKAGFGIPEGEGSCHTKEVAGYAAEGHVPAEALLQLIDQAPEVDGIALAGMPVGSPGMSGEQQEPFVVRTFVDGEVDGELGRY
jgi:hypothetical protein